uniref:MYM-type domain-containing protein n=1 Tax=viral metagenome TaxID=1070528 RepID=A0A6C0DFS3_9ZZZZ
MDGIDIINEAIMNNNVNADTTPAQVAPVKGKRGRRSKKEIEMAKALENKLNNPDVNDGENHVVLLEPKKEEETVKPPPKKRGRKPKGGKIVQQTVAPPPKKEEKPNIILHLKCSLKDLDENSDFNMKNNSIESFTFENSKKEFLYEVIDNNQDKYLPNTTMNPSVTYNSNDLTNNLFTAQCQKKNIDNEEETKEIWRKLKNLEYNLHTNNISDKKSACFWCSYDFDNPPIYIPKYVMKDTYHVYGCFCTPECATAHLMGENIDTSTKFERYYLLNHIYSKIYNYTKNIKPAPDPHHMLEKYYGSLTIQEYRSILKTDRLFLIVDKPLTRILPEFHEDNDEFIINNKIIPSNNYQAKSKLATIKKNQTKSSILSEKFGL